MTSHAFPRLACRSLPGPRDDLPRARQLLTPACLAALLGKAEAAPPWRLFEVAHDGAAAFASGHIEGAGYLDTALFEGGDYWNKVDDARLEQVLLAHGIGHDSTVILYGRNNLAAARVAHLLLYAGVDDVRLLDGGLGAWCGEGRPLRAGLARSWPARGSFGVALPLRPALLLGTAQVKAALADDGATLVSTRSWPEFIGATSGYPYIPARGDIAGARWGRAGADGDVNSMSAFHDADGRMKPAAEIARMWSGAGIDGGDLTVFYCGTGWRASLAFFYAWLMGWERIAVYDGGWCEWSADGGNAVVCRVAGVGAGDVVAGCCGR